MKKITQTLVTGFLILNTLPVFAAEVLTPISTSKKWTANKVTDHVAWGSDGCMSSTPSVTTLDSDLEIYSESVNGLYAEPIIEVIFKQPKQVYSADVNTEKGTKWTFTLASAPADPSLQAVMARLNDRQAIVQSLRSDSMLTVKLKDATGKAIAVMQYSLSGSSAAIDSQFNTCNIKFEAIP